MTLYAPHWVTKALFKFMFLEVDDKLPGGFPWPFQPFRGQFGMNPWTTAIQHSNTTSCTNQRRNSDLLSLYY